MEAKDKAREIVIKMQFQKEPLMFEQAKQCSLVTVEEIISIKREYLNPNSESIFYSYWQQVKTEIENL